VWQGELVAAGLKHSNSSMHHLLAALDRLGYVDDCLQLAKLNDEKKTGTFKAHRTALMVGYCIEKVAATVYSVDIVQVAGCKSWHTVHGLLLVPGGRLLSGDAVTHSTLELYRSGL
jgi:hypothetical protein